MALIGLLIGWWLSGYGQMEGALVSASGGERSVMDAGHAAVSSEYEEIARKAGDLGIAIRRFERMQGAPKGYYIVVGVFKESGNLAPLIESLKGRGLDAGSLRNPENGLNYVYAGSYEDGWNALEAAASKLGGSYAEPLWLLAIDRDSGSPKVPAVYEPVAESASTPPSAPGSIEKVRPEPAIADPGIRLAASGDGLSSNQLVRKANAYFDRMWYSEAAQLYEDVFRRYPEQKTIELVERVADAHYFNSDMELAHSWYEQLYDLQQDEMSAEYLYKYAQASKGKGKYGRARRLLKLYDKKLDESPQWQLQREEIRNREAALDELLNSKEAFGVDNLSINSKYSDFAPMYYGEGQVVYASSVDSAFFKTRRYKWNEQPYLDLYVARMNRETSALESAVKFSRKINTKYHEAAVAFSPDQKTMYFTRNNYGKKLKRDRVGVNHLKLYRSRKLHGEWTEAEELPFNGEDFSTGHPALSPDGRKLYFVSDRPGTMGDTDIFAVDILEDGSFSAPKNLGAEINTEQKEMFPFIAGERLYFSSNGHIGLGGLDIFEARLLEEGGFGEVKNIGKPINSKSDDFSFIINRETQTGYFASNRRGGKGDDDLYSFERLIPEVVANNAIAGVVTDRITGDALPDALVALLDENNMKLKEMFSEADGSFVFEELDSNTRYRLQVTKERYAGDQKHVKTLENEIVPAEIALQKLEERIIVEEGIRKLKAEKVFFDFDAYSIREDAAAELDELVAVMKEHPGMVIKIESHTDSRGPASYNKYLSDRRAKASRDYLIRKGIHPDRIESAIGYGEEQLLNSCDGGVRCTPAEHQMNRRSEFIIVRM